MGGRAYGPGGRAVAERLFTAQKDGCESVKERHERAERRGENVVSAWLGRDESDECGRARDAGVFRCLRFVEDEMASAQDGAARV